MYRCRSWGSFIFLDFCSLSASPALALPSLRYEADSLLQPGSRTVAVRIQEWPPIQGPRERGRWPPASAGSTPAATRRPGPTKAFVSFVGQMGSRPWASRARKAGYLAPAPRSAWQASLGAGAGAECFDRGPRRTAAPAAKWQLLGGHGGRPASASPALHAPSRQL